MPESKKLIEPPTMSGHQKLNTAFWNELTTIHNANSSYDVDAFKKGKSTLHELETDILGDVRGKSILHLQCHFGMDSLSLARMGANVTGVDFSAESVKLAELLANELSLNTRFICSDVLELPAVLDETFDIVLATYGILCWISDLKRWGQVISHCTKSGGRFLIIDGHPVSTALSDDSTPESMRFGYSYFDRETMVLSAKGSYASDAKFPQPMEVHEWNHTIGDIINALIEAGMRIESLQEYPYCMFKKFPWMVEDEAGWWWAPNKDASIPHLFSLLATK